MTHRWNLVWLFIWTARALHVPALARWSDVTGSQGEAKLADSAWPLGVVETITGGVASVVVSGELSDATAIMSLMGTSNPVAGVYFFIRHRGW